MHVSVCASVVKLLAELLVVNIHIVVLVGPCGNGVDHINKVKLRGVQLVLGLVTIFGGYAV